jgi:phospholipid-binding lipoprotein MlaA
MIVTIRRAFTVITALYLVFNLGGCAVTLPTRPPEEPAMHTVREIDDEYIARIDDPWEGFNRKMYRFNYNFDKFFYLPVVNAYEFITPIFVQTGVTNFFNNIGEFRTLYNSLLQAKGEKAMTTAGRFLINSTIGVVGLFDPATSMGLQPQHEDFGQTLAYWGVDTGPYLVMPVLGPGTVRSTSGFAVDSGVHIAIANAVDLDDDIQTAGTVLKAIDARHKQPFRYHESGYPFEYYMVRFLYHQKREMEAMK